MGRSSRFTHREKISVPTSTPCWAFSTITAMSATLREVMTAPMKSSDPGVSKMLSLWSMNSVYITVE